MTRPFLALLLPLAFVSLALPAGASGTDCLDLTWPTVGVTCSPVPGDKLPPPRLVVDLSAPVGPDCIIIDPPAVGVECLPVGGQAQP